MRDMHSSNTGLSGKILLWGQISPIILFAGRGGNKESNSVRIHFPHFIPLTVNARSLRLVWPRFTANRSVRAGWKLSLILSGACYSCRCSLAGSQSVRSGRGFQSAFCVSHRHTQYGLKKKLTVKLVQVTKQHSQKFSCGWNASIMTNRGTKKQVLRLECHLLQTAGCLYK